MGIFVHSSMSTRQKTGGERKLEKTILLKILNRRELVQMRTGWEDGIIISE